LANGNEVLLDRSAYIEELKKLRADPTLLYVEKKKEDKNNKK
jgi:hypothetical protein